MKGFIRTIAISLLFMLSPTVWSQVVINEYCGANVTVSTDNFGENSDWVELYNAGAGAVNLSGYWMSDKLSNIQKWQVPAINLSLIHI